MRNRKWTDEERELLRQQCKRTTTWRKRCDAFAERGFDRTPVALKSMARELGCMPIRSCFRAKPEDYEAIKQRRYEDGILDYVDYVEDISPWRY